MKPLENTCYYVNGAFYKWDSAAAEGGGGGAGKWVSVTDPVYTYVDYMTGVHFEWHADTSEWKAKESAEQQQQKPAPAQTAAASTTNKKDRRAAEASTGPNSSSSSS